MIGDDINNIFFYYDVDVARDLGCKRRKISTKTSTTSAQSVSEMQLVALPQSIATSSILPFLTCDDWLSFRVASRSCYEIVHGTSNICHACCPKCQPNSSQLASSTNQGGGVTSIDEGNNPESEALWRLALIRDFRFQLPSNNTSYPKPSTDSPDTQLYSSIHSPLDERGGAFLTTNNVFIASNAFTSWKHWRKVDRRLHHRRLPGNYINPGERVVGSYFLRAASLWKKIEQWCDNDQLSGSLGGSIKAALSPGVALDPNLLTSDGGEYDAQVSALKAVYAFYSGQYTSDRFSSRHGLFGGYAAYDFRSITYWLKTPHFSNDNFEVMIAVDSLDCFNKEVVMDLTSGQVYIKSDQSVRFCATPITKKGSVVSSVNGGQQEVNQLHPYDSVLRWFEEHARRLHGGLYSVGPLSSSHHSQTSLSILQYPSAADTVHCSRAVTRGVEVLASSIFVPGFTLSRDGGIFLFSIRMRLLTKEDGEDYMPPNQRAFDTCQLVSRHWKVTAKRGQSSDPVVEEVRGEGVVGEYPLLSEGGFKTYYSEGGASTLAQSSSFEDHLISEGSGLFSYQSCSDKNSTMMEGHFQFIPGNINEPHGAIFNVRIAPFQLNTNPDFLY